MENNTEGSETVDLEFTLKYIAKTFGEGYVFDFMDKLSEDNKHG